MKYAICVGVALAVLQHWLTGSGVGELLRTVAAWSVPLGILLCAISWHEYAHGAAALLFGDGTARDKGRLTLNPLAHFDFLGLVVVPLGLIALGSPVALGWAKPVPVDFRLLRPFRRGMFAVAVAGPAASLAAALGGAVVLRVLGVDGTEGVLASAAWTFVFANLAIALFNLLPLYPMDGGRMVVAALPTKCILWLMQNEGKAVIAALLLIIGVPWTLSAFGVEASPIPWISGAVLTVAEWMTGTSGTVWYEPLRVWLGGEGA